ncbi:hypothetical protein TNCV_3962111 [Trichonephila clavipes]|nr:hypothetical protein TNCV_3962111 [Trichonephila clavipes]
MLQDYDTSFSRLYFSPPRFSSPPLSSPVPSFFPLSLPDPSLYLVSRSTCCQRAINVNFVYYRIPKQRRLVRFRSAGLNNFLAEAY